MVATRFGLPRKSGNLQTGITGNHGPDSVATYLRNAWQPSSEIRILKRFDSFPNNLGHWQRQEPLNILWQTLEIQQQPVFLSMVSVDDLQTTKTGFNFDGKIMSFEATVEFYVESLKEMYERPESTHDP